MSDILIKPPQLRSIASVFNSSANTIQGCIDAVDQQINALGPARFQGVSAETILLDYQNLREKVYSFKPTIDSFASELEIVADRFEKADKSLQSIV
jgi:WXG100 family type VII secretion target